MCRFFLKGFLAVFLLASLNACLFSEDVDDFDLTYSTATSSFGIKTHLMVDEFFSGRSDSFEGYTYRFDACSEEEGSCELAHQDANGDWTSPYNVCECEEWHSCQLDENQDYLLTCDIPTEWVTQNKNFRLVERITRRDNLLAASGLSPTLSISDLVDFGRIARAARRVAERRRARDEGTPPEDSTTCTGGQEVNSITGLCECPDGQEIPLGGTECAVIGPPLPGGGGESGGAVDCGGNDLDCDTIPDDGDNCPGTANADQVDSDMDDLGDACDQCPNISREERLNRAPGQRDETGFWLEPAAGCPAGLAPTTSKNIPEATGTGGSSGGGSCALVKTAQGSFKSFALLLIFLGALFFTSRKIASRNSLRSNLAR